MYTDATNLKNCAKTINDHFGADIVKYYSDTRNPNSLPSITGKIEGGLEGFSTLMKKVFGANVKVEQLSGDLARKVSGKYDSFSVTISRTAGFYFRSIIGDRGSLTDKDLTPNKLGLNGKTITKRDAETIIEAGLLNIADEIPMEVFSLAQELIYLAAGSGTTIRTTKEITKLLGSISATDLKKFGKNYGEVILAVWCLNNKTHAESVYFPEEENNPLADFVVNFTKASKIPPLNVSAKFEGGANASLKSIMPENSTPPKSATDVEVKAYKAIMAVAYDKVVDGLLNAEAILDTPEYKAIKKMVGGGTPTLQNISKAVEKALHESGIDATGKWDKTSPATKAKYDSYLKKMEPFYSKIPGKSGGRPSIDTMPKIAGLGSGKYYHPVMYAFSVALADHFNNNVEFSSVLDKAATSIKAEQIYLDIGAQNITVKVKEFAKSKFEFAAGAFAYSSDNVRMKVKMLK